MIIPGFNRSIPVMAGIQENKTNSGGESVIVQMVREAGKTVEMMEKPAILLLDAFFFSKTPLITAAQCIGKNGQALLPVIIRAKRFAVAYREPESGSGKKTEVHYLCMALIQRPTRQRVRFFLTIIGTTHFILMPSSGTLDCETIISLYAQRFKVEGLFGELKNKLGGFAHHFWTHSLEKRKEGTVPVLPKGKKKFNDVEKTKKSIETYMFCQGLSYVRPNQI
jgi:hypothetical protein